ncbi:MAG: serine hydrolase [bacterium]|nr:MAG: serine hydrolase [bacterium]
MKHFSVIFVLVVLVSTFTAVFPQIQQQDQQKIFVKTGIESYGQFRNANSHVFYDSTALDSFILATMNTYHFPGVQACIVKDDQLIWKGAYGYANIGHNRPVTDSTLFYLASISKTFAATAMMQLWENGSFNLDDDINNYLPFFQVRNPYHPNTPITFRMLLTHTSSIRDNSYGLGVKGSDSPIRLDSFLVNYLVPGGSYYHSSNYNSSTPGTKWEYTNKGVALIGYLVETISNSSFEQYCQDSIFIPLGMYETSWFQANLDTTHIAMPYYYSGGSYHPYGHHGTPGYPASQLRTSAVQLSRFLRAYIQNGQIDGVRILDSTTVDLMTTEHLLADPNMVYWWPYWQGFIWRIYSNELPYWGNQRFCGHWGASQGARAGMDYVFNNVDKLGVIVLNNGESEPPIIQKLVNELFIYEYLYDEIFSHTDEVPMDYSLKQNYPNPFNPKTNIEFSIYRSEFVRLKLYNLLGQEVATLVSEKLAAGNYKYDWDAGNLASGVYLYRLQAGDYVQTRKMVLMR